MQPRPSGGLHEGPGQAVTGQNPTERRPRATKEGREGERGRDEEPGGKAGGSEAAFLASLTENWSHP